MSWTLLRNFSVIARSHRLVRSLLSGQRALVDHSPALRARRLSRPSPPQHSAVFNQSVQVAGIYGNHIHNSKSTGQREGKQRRKKTFLIGLVHCGCRTRDCCYPRSQAVLAFSTPEPTCQTRRLQPPKEDPQFTRLTECNYFSANPENFRDGHKNTQDEDEVQFTVSQCPISIK